DGEYAFVPDTDRLVEIRRGDIMLVGKLDADGNFLEERRFDGPTSAGTKPSVLLNGKPGLAYEYRAGRLIKGEIRADGNFVPEAGSTVILFKDYRYSPTPSRSGTSRARSSRRAKKARSDCGEWAFSSLHAQGNSVRVAGAESATPRGHALPGASQTPP